MLHNNFRGNRFTGSGKKMVFLGFLPIYRHGGYVTKMPQTNFCFPTHRGFTLIGQAVSEKMFEHYERRRRTDEQTPEHEYAISSKVLYSKRIYSASGIWRSFYSSHEKYSKTNKIAFKRNRLN